MNMQTLYRQIMSTRRPVRLVSVDGPGGAGKSTFAAQLAAACSDAPVIHTDDFASRDVPTEWWPRLLLQVIEPLMSGRSSRYQRYDWHSNAFTEWVSIAPSPIIIIIEGVSAGRIEWAHHLAFSIWIDTPSDERLRRGLDRDGPEARDEWCAAMDREDRFFGIDPCRSRADVIVDGTGPWPPTS